MTRQDDTNPRDGTPGATLFDVVYLDEHGRSRNLATSVPAEDAVRIAKREAERRHVGRMFSAGSPPQSQCVLVVPAGTSVESVASRW